MASILVLDDDPLIQRLILSTAAEFGHEALAASTLAEGVAQCRDKACDIVFLDVLLPDGNGLDSIPALRGLPQPPEIVIITGHGDPAGANLAIRHGAWDFLTKPLSLNKLQLTLNRVVAFRQQRQAAGQTDKELRNIVGVSQALRACLDLASQAAASDINVLLLGETGTGKEVFARAIHEGSARAVMPFVTMDCASATESLLESQLFGHTRGSFTGADQDRDGVVRLAHRGTLFLDEVGELPVSLQRSFLRVLETRRFRPIGARTEVPSDFRLIAATNRNLIEMASMDLFRTDLLYRLNGIAITLPPLRERKEDIPLLCRHFVTALCARYDACGKTVSDDLMEALSQYDWPGNVRELGHALEWAFAASRGEPAIFAGHLPLDIRMAVARSRLHQNAGRAPDRLGAVAASGAQAYQSYRDFKDTSEKAYLKGLLKVAASVSEAARLSGLSRGHLYQLLKKHGLEI
ncbi:sigma-54-dependent transcriptional regulator [Solidesulfovibrio sp. C21]|uniref:sigma-54-dependent transcriptional regulator n=1 Tax=Solidesulfovibrio sp. C21 TaxID=3398613 RepID=UPI0039FBE6D5